MIPRPPQLAARAAAALLLSASATPVPAQTLELRGVHEPVPGDVIAVERQGVTLQHAGETRLVGWDRVRAVGGPLADEAGAFASLADTLWRARARLERDDVDLAEPLFEAAFAEFAGIQGPSAAVAAEGLLRCRLRRGAQHAALAPWLAALAARESAMLLAPVGLTEAPGNSPWIGGTINAQPVLTPQGLCPALPPIWLSGPATETLATSRPALPGSPTEPSDDTTPLARALGEWYRAAARFESGLEADLALPAPGPAELVRDMVIARAGLADERRTAREALRARIDAGVPGWTEAWCRVALGRSLLREADDSLRRLGVLELLHVPARQLRDQPYLAGVALAEAAVELNARGDHRGALRLADEIRTHLPGHPALHWTPLRQLARPEPQGNDSSQTPNPQS